MSGNLPQSAQRPAQDVFPPFPPTAPWPPNPIPGEPAGPPVQNPGSWEYGFNAGTAIATFDGLIFQAPGGPLNQLATLGDIAEATTGVSSFNTRTGAVSLELSDVTGVGGAPANSPALSGVPTCPTAATSTSTTQIASTAFVQSVFAANLPGVQSFNGRQGAVTLTLSDIQTAGGAPSNNAQLTGISTVPTAGVGTATGQIASTAFVMNAVGAAVVSWNGRVGNVTMTLSDITSVGGAPIASPAMTGVPTAPTASSGTATQQIATTAFVQNAVQAATVGVSSFNTRTGAVVLTTADVVGAGGAPIAGPVFTGNPQAATQPAGTDNDTLATTAFVTTALAGASVVSSFNGRTGAVTLQESDVAGANGMTTAGGTFTGTITLAGPSAGALQPVAQQQLATYAPLASPALTGTPTVPTATIGTNTTQAASTAFVQAAVAAAPYDATNYVDNSAFVFNQRNVASGAALVAGQFGFDRWKGGPAAGGTLTYAGSAGMPAQTTVTITAGSVQQVIEGANLLTATYTLSWAGTAQGRIAGASGGGTYAASPLTFAATANTNAFVEFTGGTLGQVKLQLGSIATQYQPVPLATELGRCLRFYQNLTVTQRNYAAAAGAHTLNTITIAQMRTSPTMTPLSGGTSSNVSSAPFTVQNANTVTQDMVAIAAGDFLISGVVYALSADL